MRRLWNTLCILFEFINGRSDIKTFVFFGDCRPFDRRYAPEGLFKDIPSLLLFSFILLSLFDPKSTLLNSLPNKKKLEWSKLKAFADDIINIIEMIFFLPQRVEIIVGKRKYSGLQAFSPFLTMISKFFF